MNITDTQDVNTINHETSVFVTQENPRIVNAPEVSKADYVKAGTSEIADFCRRPVEIANVAPASASSITPWDTWLSNPAVAAKLRNYALIKGTMCLRFMVNAQPFWYGRYLIYMDFDWGQTTTSVYTNTWESSYSSDYRVLLDLCVDQAVELRIPYFRNAQWLNPLAIAQGDKVQLQAIYGPYDAQSGAAVSPTIKVYAWVEDLETAIPVSQSTNTNGISITKVPTEQKVGTISAPLSALSKVATTLEDVPIIGGVAGQVSTIAAKMGAAASLFGFSKPADLRDRPHMVTKAAADMATTEGLDPAYKLTMDPKHSKSVDPRTADGSAYDVLSLNYIAGRPGLIALYAMTPAATVGTRLAQIRNAPGHMFSKPNNGYQLTPLAYASLAFNKWSGSLIYKFSVICSRYHRGRVAIYWNNVVPTESVISNLTNVVFLEIGPGNECELIVPWASPFPTLTVAPKDITDNTPLTAIDNGFVFIDVDQQLTCPSASANIAILVTVRAGPDFTLGAPSNSYLRYMYDIPYQSSTLNTALLQTQYSLNAPAPGVWTPVPINQASKTNNLVVTNSSLVDVSLTKSEAITSEVFGESFVSFRALMKRYNYLGSTNYTTTAGNDVAFILLRRLPPTPLYYNKLAAPTMLHYLSRMFLFCSGSTRFKVICSNYIANGFSIISRGLFGAHGYGFTAKNDTATYLLEHVWNSPTMAGSSIQLASSGVAEFEVPDMSGYRMLDCSLFLTNTNGDACTVVFDTPATIGPYSAGLDIYQAASDDFNFFVFRGIPIIFFQVPYTTNA